MTHGEKINVLCVLYGDWPDGARYLDRIRDSVSSNVTRHRLAFHCLTDRWSLPAPWNAIAFDRDFHSKLKKLEMFRKDICYGERVCYLDLDMSIIGNIDHILDYSGRFGIRSEFPNCKGASPVQSSFIMFVGGEHSYLYERACKMDSEGTLAKAFPIGGGRGDQLFIGEYVDGWDDLENLYPGACVSFKWGWRAGKCDRDSARIIYHHGKGASPHEVGWSPGRYGALYSRNGFYRGNRS